jgi:hypothetical protein
MGMNAKTNAKPINCTLSRRGQKPDTLKKENVFTEYHVTEETNL